MIEFQQSEPTAARRQWIIVLVDSVDGVTGKTGQTGQVYVSKNGGTPALSTNSIVEIDSTNMPGQYYIQLTAGELDTLGFISITKKNAGTLAFHDRGFVSYDDPFARHGGFSTGPGAGSKSGGVTKAQADDLLKKFREMIQEELAKDEGDDNKEEVQEQKDYTEMLEKIYACVEELKSKEFPETDFSPVLEAFGSIEKPKDYSGNFSALEKSVGAMTPVVADFGNAVKAFEGKMGVAEEQINGALKTVKTITDGFAELETMMAKFKDTFETQTDMDKRFASINGKMKDEALQAIEQKITKLGQSMILILKQLNK